MTISRKTDLIFWRFYKFNIRLELATKFYFNLQEFILKFRLMVQISRTRRLYV